MLTSLMRKKLVTTSLLLGIVPGLHGLDSGEKIMIGNSKMLFKDVETEKVGSAPMDTLETARSSARVAPLDAMIAIV